ncbi:hypothetical protein GCM10027275_49550 [Rhabdobacter roseus]|jgi:hypothetical protein|uniref:DUF2911 domain-containing protein n=1 Tax=Rhabdobacter roseus TaxID=1655419 RepID=A0A840TRP7_9BACT|nr:DUF2911 domain-containing protein [Rhabdobacter roseus]MBB5287016.1 hypothetical protein [Rhabdobacter roseus]
MKTTLHVFVAVLISSATYAQHEHHQPAESETAKPKPKSPRQSAMAMVGDNHVHVDYGSPSVRGRQIWNGLVAYDQVWASGAHKATWIDFSQDVTINGKLVPKGKYGFFTIPGPKEWTLILSKDWDMHLADDYKPEQDIVRVQVKPEMHQNVTEALTYEVVPEGKKKGEIKMRWDKLSVSLPFQNK